MVKQVVYVAGLFAIAVSGLAMAQSATAPFPPSNLELRNAEFALRQQQLVQERTMRQESRVRQLTGGGTAASSAEVADLATGSTTVGRIAVQAMIGAVIAAALTSAGTEDAGLLAEISPDSDTSSSGGSGSSSPAATSTTTTATSTL